MTVGDLQHWNCSSQIFDRAQNTFFLESKNIIAIGVKQTQNEVKHKWVRLFTINAYFRSKTFWEQSLRWWDQQMKIEEKRYGYETDNPDIHGWCCEWNINISCHGSVLHKSLANKVPMTEVLFNNFEGVIIDGIASWLLQSDIN